MKRFISSNFIPEEVKFLTAGKRYEVVDSLNDYKGSLHLQVMVKDDNGRVVGPINIGRPCAYLDGQNWSFEIIENED